MVHCVLTVAALNDVTVDVVGDVELVVSLVIDDAELVVISLVISLVIGADVVVMMRLWSTLDCRCLLGDQRPFTLPVNSQLSSNQQHDN